MQNRFERFLGLSAVLTGFSRIELLGTGMAGEYLRTIDAVTPASLLDELMAAYERLPAGAAHEAVPPCGTLDDPKLESLAEGLILLWYLGTSPSDRTRVVSAEAYQAGLQWVVAGAHPPGAQQQGFGAWSFAP
jgi:hypothetical protein